MIDFSNVNTTNHPLKNWGRACLPAPETSCGRSVALEVTVTDIAASRLDRKQNESIFFRREMTKGTKLVPSLNGHARSRILSEDGHYHYILGDFGRWH